MYLPFHLGISALNPGSNFFSWESNTQLSRSLAVAILFILKKQNQKELGFLWDIQIRLVQTHREIFFTFWQVLIGSREKNPGKGMNYETRREVSIKYALQQQILHPNKCQIFRIQASAASQSSHKITHKHQNRGYSCSNFQWCHPPMILHTEAPKFH